MIERAAILAAGADFPAVMDWISAHAGTPETAVSSTHSTGLHGSRLSGGGAAPSGVPLRFVLPANSLS